MGLFDKLFGTYSERELKKIDKTVCQIEALEDCCVDNKYHVDIEPDDISTSDSVRITFRIE